MTSADTANLISSPDQSTGRGAPNVPTVEQLYVASQTELRSRCYERWPDLLVFDADAVLSRLAAQLPGYDGPPVANAFEHWASAIINGEVDRIRIASELWDGHHKLIRAAVWSTSGCRAEDAAVLPEDLESELRFLLWRHADSISTPGRAKQSTRVYALVKMHVWSMHIRNRLNRRRIVEERQDELASGGCEVLSALELAQISEKAEDFSPA